MKKEGKKVSLLAIGSVLVLGAFLWGGDLSGEINNTANDSELLSDTLRESSGSGVLGASSENDEDKCPSDKSVIGWIDYSGEKLIVEILPQGQKPNACFETEEKANEEGFFKEE